MIGNNDENEDVECRLMAFTSLDTGEDGDLAPFLLMIGKSASRRKKKIC